MWGGDCGFDFETGQDYLVYAGRDDKGILWTTHCSDTELTEFAETDLRILRGEPPSPTDLLDEKNYWEQFNAQHTSDLRGRAIRSDGTPVSEDQLELSRERHDGFPLSGYPSGVGWATTEPDGSFCVERVRRGTYNLSLKDYDPNTDTQFVGSLSKIHVEGGKNVGGLNLVLHKDRLYQVRKHVVLLILIAGGVALVVGMAWLLRRRRRVVS